MPVKDSKESSVDSSESSKSSEDEYDKNHSKTPQKRPNTPTTPKGDSGGLKILYVEISFQDCGEVVDVRPSIDEDGRFKGFGHVEVVTSEASQKELQVGEPIAPTLRSAIEESRIAIVVFSENYAESSWCLDEFAKIMECHRQKSQMVFPIFYKVEQSDVTHQRGSYGEAMTKHETKFGVESEKVRNWKSSLAEVANLKGYHLRPGYEEEYEHKMIEEIVSEASIILSPRSLHIKDDIVGVEDRVEELKSILEMESKDITCFLGIHGTGGIGKTTLAKALYNSICNRFRGACFLFNVRETSKQYEGQKLILETLIAEILQEGIFHLTSVDEGINTIKMMFDQERVLLVLDDVDDNKELDVLTGVRDWFGSGSRIIVTTRDKHLLDVYKVKNTNIYEMKVLNGHHSMKLFCQNAFKLNCPATNYEEISKRAVNYANGIPLALKVIGSHLFGKTMGEWKSALDKYENIPNKDIQSILRISYDGLESNEQDIFLDIACFFKGQEMEYIKTILKKCDFSPEEGIRILVDRSLITVERSCLMMHDLIQLMGREIVREENPKDAGERSRLWFHKDVQDVLTNDMGSSKIEGMILDPPQRDEKIEGIDTALQKMEKLRILIIRYTIFSRAPSFLPNELRLLDWKEYPSPSFPPHFKPNKIVAFKLLGSLLEQPFLACEHLTYVDVSFCNSITQIPDMSLAKSLKELKLDGCKNLVIVDDSVGFLPNLVYFSASGCFQLQSFVPEIDLPSLEYLSFNLCRNLKHFPEVVGVMDKPLNIYLMDTSIEELPDSIGNLIGLGYLEMTGCYRLRHLPSSFFTLPNLVTLKVVGCVELPESFRRHEVSKSVRTLHFEETGLYDEDLPMIIHSFPNLENLDMSCNYFTCFPMCIQDTIFLRSLDVSGCFRLQDIPMLPSSVQKVNAIGCYRLKLETLDMLWSQVHKKINKLEVVMPGISRKILERQQFDLGGVGGVPVFNARGKFPVVAIAFAFKQFSGRGSLPTHWKTVCLKLFIEGEPIHCKHYYVADSHVLLCDLRVMFSDEELEGLNARLDRDWKTVRVVCETSMVLIWWGVNVYMGETNMDDIQFTTSQDHSIVRQIGKLHLSQYHPMVQPGQVREESKEDNVIDSINVPVMVKGFLRDVRDNERQGEFHHVAPGFHESNQTLLAGLGKMLKSVTPQREGNNNSRFDLEDEDIKEGQSTLRWIAETILADEEKTQKEEVDNIWCHLPKYQNIMERQLHEGGIMIRKRLYDQMVQARKTFGPSSIRQDDEDDDEVIKVDSRTYQNLLQAYTTTFAS